MHNLFKLSLSVKLVPVVLVLWLGLADQSFGQLFGPREFGRPFQSRRNAPSPSLGAEAGSLQGNERFLRENRSRNAFVGSDRSSQQGFVGSEQAIGTGRVVAATESLQPPPDPSSRVNRPIPSLPENQMYYPRLKIGFLTSKKRSAAKAITEKDAQLRKRLQKIAGPGVNFETQGAVTILSGVVSSQPIFTKLGIIASFEPHVGQIENRLRIVSSLPPSQP